MEQVVIQEQQVMGHTQQLAPVFFLMDEITDEMLQDRCHPVGIEVIDDDRTALPHLGQSGCQGRHLAQARRFIGKPAGTGLAVTP